MIRAVLDDATQKYAGRISKFADLSFERVVGELAHRGRQRAMAFAQPLQRALQGDGTRVELDETVGNGAGAAEQQRDEVAS